MLFPLIKPQLPNKYALLNVNWVSYFNKINSTKENSYIYLPTNALTSSTGSHSISSFSRLTPEFVLFIFFVFHPTGLAHSTELFIPICIKTLIKGSSLNYVSFPSTTLSQISLIPKMICKLSIFGT